MLAATALAGVSGYAIQIIAAATIPNASAYVTFSVFWSTMFLFGGAVGGTQQEIARATHPGGDAGSGSVLRRFTGLAVAAVVVVGAVASVFLGMDAFAAAPWSLSTAFLIGLVGYILTSILTGLLYGLGQPGIVGGLIATDAVLRGVAVVAGLLVGAPIEYLAFAIAIPFGLSVGVVWLASRARVRRRFRVDGSVRMLVANSSRTVLASASLGVMVAGLPLLLGITLSDAAPAVAAALILAITVTRAPLIIPLTALQSFLIVHLRGYAGNVRRRVLALLGIVAAAGAAAVLLGYLWGAPLIEFISIGNYTSDPVTLAVVIASAALIGMMCVTSAALLAGSRHNAFLAGWVVAAALTIALLVLLPIDPITRTLVGVSVPPAVGLVIHLSVVLRMPVRNQGVSS